VLFYEITDRDFKRRYVNERRNQEVKVRTNVVNSAGRSFSEIISLVDQVSQQVGNIAMAMQTIAVGSHEIVASMQLIEDVSKEISSRTQTVSAAAEEQSATMEKMRSQASRRLKWRKN
jgi:methyl-accepting chemotaxis protein